MTPLEESRRTQQGRSIWKTFALWRRLAGLIAVGERQPVCPEPRPTGWSDLINVQVQTKADGAQIAQLQGCPQFFRTAPRADISLLGAPVKKQRAVIWFVQQNGRPVAAVTLETVEVIKRSGSRIRVLLFSELCTMQESWTLPDVRRTKAVFQNLTTAAEEQCCDVLATCGFPEQERLYAGLGFTRVSDYSSWFTPLPECALFVLTWSDARHTWRADPSFIELFAPPHRPHVVPVACSLFPDAKRG